MGKHGEWNHIEIPAADLERTKGFYQVMNQGWCAVIQDSEGNASALWQQDPVAAGS